MPEKLTVGVLFGGRSGEHAVSLRSAASVMEAMDKSRYRVVPVGITEQGSWLAGGDPMGALKNNKIPGDCCFAVMTADPQNPGLLLLDPESPDRIKDFVKLDLIFPVLHGPYGEDGTVQGLLELSGLPYAGSGVLASAAGMDKVIMKILFKQANLPIGDYLYFNSTRWAQAREQLIEQIKEQLGYPCFVKPANLGSSVGVSKAHDPPSLIEGVEEAMRYDNKIVVEALIEGREIECSVLGDEAPLASVPGEIIPCNEFYDYWAKYIDDRSELVIPAPMDQAMEEKVKACAIAAFQAVECSGLARVDFFLNDETGMLYVNEVNTMPGFTSISMYPKLWEASGVSYPEQIDRIIQVALQRHRRKKVLLTSFEPGGANAC